MRLIFWDFQKAMRLKTGPSCPPKNMKNFNVKIKILKRRLVLIQHQFLWKRARKSAFLGIRSENETKLHESLYFNIKSIFLQSESDSYGAIGPNLDYLSTMPKKIPRNLYTHHASGLSRMQHAWKLNHRFSPTIAEF